jgi:TolC family type I secretion outer membrane protein
MKQLIRIFSTLLCVLGLANGSGLAEKSQAPAAALPDLAVLKVLDLKTAGQMALAGNPSVAAARARVRQAREQVVQANAAYWPRLDATASASRITLSDNAHTASLSSARLFDPTAAIDDPEKYYNTGLTATWVLFNGFERRFTAMAARSGEKLSRAGRHEVQRLILSATANTFFMAQLARENIAIATADEAFNLRQLNEAEARRRVGTGSLSDELNFKVRVNSARSDKIRAQQTYKTALFSLTALLGVPDAAFPPGLELAPLSPEVPMELRVPDTEAQLDQARIHRPDLQQAQFAIQQAGAGVKIARARLFPTLALTASLNGERSGDANLEENDFGNVIALNLSYNLFAGGADRAGIRAARAGRVAAEKNMEDLELNVNSNVMDALTALEAALAQLSLQQTNEALVEQNRDLVEKEYKAGQGSLVRLNEAQRDLVIVRSRLALARISLRQAWIGIKTATGTITSAFE